VVTRCAPKGIFYRQWAGAIRATAGPPLALLIGAWLLIVIGSRVLKWIRPGFRQKPTTSPTRRVDYTAFSKADEVNDGGRKQMETPDQGETQADVRQNGAKPHPDLDRINVSEASRPARDALTTLKSRLSWSVALATGLDITLRAVARDGQPDGTNLFLFGLIAIGLYCLARARFAKNGSANIVSERGYVAAYWLIVTTVVMLTVKRLGGE